MRFWKKLKYWQRGGLVSLGLSLIVGFSYGVLIPILNSIINKKLTCSNFGGEIGCGGFFGFLFFNIFMFLIWVFWLLLFTFIPLVLIAMLIGFLKRKKLTND